MKKLIVLLLCGICLSCNTKSESGKGTGRSTASVQKAITDELERIHQQGQINGFAVAIVNREHILYASGIGFADIEKKREYTAKTIQNIGSVSKTFIGIALLKAQELGTLHLDDPVNDYLPFSVSNPHHPEAQITIRHLATHTSTILDTDYYDEKAYVLKDRIETTEEVASRGESFNPPESRISMMAFLEKLLSREGEWYEASGFSDKQPGALFAYSNVGATLAAAVLETATGQTFKAFATQHILEPLKMASSGWSFEDIDLSQHSRLYANPETPLPYYSLITYPDGGLIASIEDMGTYLIELIKGYGGAGVLLDAESYKELFRPQLDARNLPDRDIENDYDDEYNSGIFMGFTPRGYVGHTGGDPGIATYMFFDPATGIGRILMINTSIVNEEGVTQFYAIWNTLAAYEKELEEHVRKPSNKEYN